MASYHLYLTLSLLLLSFTRLVSSLSTFSISETSNVITICALTTNSSLNCTSFGSPSPVFSVNPSASFSGVVSGEGFVCTLRTVSSSSSSFMYCWRFSANNMTNVEYKEIYKGPALSQLEAGNSDICGLVNGSNGVQCWPWRRWGHFNTSSISQSFARIAVGQDFVCGVSQNGSISCLSPPTITSRTNVINNVPNGNFSEIAAGFRRVCAINAADGGLFCWTDTVRQEEVPRGQFKGLALGENRTCALRDNRTVVCWGPNNFSLPTELEGVPFLSIEAKRSVFCGVLRENYSLYCWGNEAFSFRSNYLVFEEIMPGPCTKSCPCLALPGSGNICGNGESICEPCKPPPLSPTPPPISPTPPPVSPTPPPPVPPSRWNGKMVAFLVVGCVGSLSLVLNAAYFVYRHCRCKCRVHDSGRLDEPGGAASEHGASHRGNPQQEQPTPVLEKRLSQLASMGNAGHLEEFPLQVLLDITNKFSEDHKIGTGSFGSVYQGILEDGRQVAIKRAEASSSSTSAIVTKRQEDKNSAFLNELVSLSRLHHRNLVRLFGFCDERNELVLVYEFMSNGTLHDHLHSLESSPLMSWSKRIKVALDAARGIEYLHIYAVPPVIHRDIKSSNILLDTTWTAKVSDFGLSLMGPTDDESHLSQRAAGTFGYIDPEYYRLQKLTTKSDVYSFGVVLLEILSGRRAIHKNENGSPRNVVDFVVPYIVQDEIHRVLDPKVPPPTPYEIEAVAYVGYLAADCVDSEGRNRPSMTEIVGYLDRALNACMIPPPTLSRSTTHSSI